MKRWLKYGLIIGISLGIILSIISVIDSDRPLSNLTYPAFFSCMFITQCIGEGCGICLFIEPIFNLIYSFIIGAIIGLVVDKFVP